MATRRQLIWSNEVECLVSAVAYEPTWVRDYVAHMTCTAGDGWLPAVTEQAQVWLREKGFDLGATDEGVFESDSGRLTVRRHRHGRSQALRMVLVEETTKVGTFCTELLAHDEPGAEDWLSLSVTNSEGRFVAVPRLARYLMDALPLHDGALELRDGAAAFHADQVDDLLHMVTDRDRHGLLFVAATTADDRISYRTFSERVSGWLREVAGLGQAVVLDPLAAAAFNARVGDGFAVPPWTIRTFQPGADLASEVDARRHKIMGTKRLGTEPDASLRRLFADVVRDHAAERNVTADIQRVRRWFERLENKALGEPPAAVPSKPTSAEASALTTSASPAALAANAEVLELTEQVGLVRKILALGELTETALRDVAARLVGHKRTTEAFAEAQARIEGLQERIERLEDHNRALTERLKDEQMETELARLDNDDATQKVRWLQSRLKDQGDYEAVWMPVPPEFAVDRPRDFDELLDRLEEMPHVAFTGDFAEVQRLKSVDGNDSALRTAWDSILTLDGYVRARSAGDCTGGLKQYIEQPPTGYPSVGPKKFAHTETAITMKGHGAERVFPVPTTVDKSGCAVMKAHFRLAHIGMASPRMYVLDAHAAEPMVYIG